MIDISEKNFKATIEAALVAGGPDVPTEGASVCARNNAKPNGKRSISKLIGHHYTPLRRVKLKTHCRTQD